MITSHVVNFKFSTLFRNTKLVNAICIDICIVGYRGTITYGYTGISLLVGRIHYNLVTQDFFLVSSFLFLYKDFLLCCVEEFMVFYQTLFGLVDILVVTILCLYAFYRGALSWLMLLYLNFYVHSLFAVFISFISKSCSSRCSSFFGSFCSFRSAFM